jgi:hypothetical protein
MRVPTQEKESPVLDAIVNRLLEYIEEHRAVSFDELHEYMLGQKLRFDPSTNPVSVLDRPAYQDRIDVDYDRQQIYSRRTAAIAVGAR